MIFKRLEIPEIVICKPEIVNDKRGYFAETFRLDKLQKYIGYNLNFCQDNESKSTLLLFAMINKPSLSTFSSKFIIGINLFISMP